eukprot:8898623-Ditylum_brightwellii.AAC.1
MNCGWATNCLSSSSEGEKEEELIGNKQKKNIERNDSKHCLNLKQRDTVLALVTSKMIQYINT